jgi:hypothetical protein
LNAIIAAVLALDIGLNSTFQPYLIGSLTGGVPVYVYLISSIIAALAFLGGTAHRVVSELSSKDLLHEVISKVNTLESGQKIQQSLLESLKARVFLVDESLNATRKEMAKKFSDQDKAIKQVHGSLVNKLDKGLADVKTGIGKQVSQGFGEQTEMLKDLQSSLTERIDTRIAEVNDAVARQLAKIEGDMQKQAQRVRKSADAIDKQEGEIADIKVTLAELEEAVVKPPEPQLTSQSKPEDVRGIGENTGNELREMGVTNVGELVTTEPSAIAAKTDMSEKMVEKLQGRAQLAMVPGVSEKDLILLEEAGVMNRKDLASQDPFELGKKINAVFKTLVEEGKMSEAEKPSVEEVDSWIRFAKA